MNETLKFVWKDEPDIGYYECILYEGDEKINDIGFEDFTCDCNQRVDKERHKPRPYAFKVGWCHGWSMSEGFDYDANCYEHLDDKGRHIGGYQGNCTHTVEDIKRWCENWLAQRYLKSYYETLDRIEQMKARAEWFESQGFSLEKRREGRNIKWQEET
ncbi:hypothetical protein [Eubacterium sp.]|uniref:hypothetical protein n=1 Tax=Eubacterium sp. TaxID=142586 RepID=UPI00258E93D5|nr:hypothetical protein [Eubacterium sp.]MCR5368403.1 hypothetical protein [Eubacterium sp.]